MNRLAAAEQFRKVLQMFCASLTEEQALEVASIYPVWQVGRAYKVGDIFSYGMNGVGDPQLYKVVQAHTSQADWIPGQGTDSIYDAFGLDESGYPVWSAPAGAHDCFNKGDIVSYNNVLYISLVNGNVWEPGTSGTESLWQIYEK